MSPRGALWGTTLPIEDANMGLFWRTGHQDISGPLALLVRLVGVNSLSLFAAHIWHQRVSAKMQKISHYILDIV